MDSKIILSDPNTQENNEDSNPASQGDDFYREEENRRSKRDRDSIIAARNEDSSSASKFRRNRREDKIPFTPEVTFIFSLYFFHFRSNSQSFYRKTNIWLIRCLYTAIRNGGILQIY